MVRLSLSSLKEGRWYEYVIRFGLGGAATAFAGFISSSFGPSIGGLFLALPAIFCASATLIEKHEIRRKREAGCKGVRRGQEAASLDAAGAALASLGLISFAVAFFLLVETSYHWAFLLAVVSWSVTSTGAWWIRRRLRASRETDWINKRLGSPARAARRSSEPR